MVSDVGQMNFDEVAAQLGAEDAELQRLSGSVPKRGVEATRARDSRDNPRANE